MGRCDEVRIVQAFKGDSKFKKGFISLYKDVFAGHPYYESYTDEYVEREVWNRHFENEGWIFLAILPDDSVIGFGCAVPTINSWECAEFLLQNEKMLPFKIEESCYMSEIGVKSDYRNLGIGTRLIKARTEYAKENGFDFYVMRTAQVGSNSINMYKKFGAQEIEGLVQDVSEHAEEVCSKSKFRIYLFGKC